MLNDRMGESSMGDVSITHGRRMVGDARLPGSKSLANRYLACAALADGESRLSGLTLADDVREMIRGLAAFGIGVSTTDSSTASEPVRVQGCSGHLPADSAEVDVGHAGTAMRFLAALACLGQGRFRLDGSSRMRQRPIGPLVGALQELGAGIGYEDQPGFPPLTIQATGLAGGPVRFDAPPSSQFISALLMIAPYAHQDVLISIDGGLVSRPYVEMTIGVMRTLGVEALANDDLSRLVVPSYQRYRGGEFKIEPDASAATYFWGAAALTGGRVRTPGLTRAGRQGDVGFVDVLARMGAVISEREGGLEVSGPPAAPDAKLRGIDVDLNAMPDTVQTLAVLALFADGPTTIRNVANLRIKETDRLAALQAELTRLGATIELRPDGLTIVPPRAVRPARIETYADHRMAMSFALAGLRVPGVVIADAGCVSKSFPGYFDELRRLASP